MIARRRVLIAIGALYLSGCSRREIKQSGFETLQGMRAQECEKDLTVECPPRERFEDYKKRRADQIESDDTD